MDQTTSETNRSPQAQGGCDARGRVVPLTCQRGEELGDEEPLWRYVPLKTLFLYLGGRALIPSLERLKQSEPHEAIFYEDVPWFNEGFARRYGQRTAQLEAWMRKSLCDGQERRNLEQSSGDAAARQYRDLYFAWVRRTRYAWCWFAWHQESAAMWYAYANQGAAVHTKVGLLKDALGQTGHAFHYRRIRYVEVNDGWLTQYNPEEENDAELLLRPFFLKRIEFHHEKEVRFVTTAARTPGDGLTISLPHPQWISEVRLSPALLPDEREAIRKAIPQGIQVEESDLVAPPERRSTGCVEFDRYLAGGAQRDWLSGRDEVPACLKSV